MLSSEVRSFQPSRSSLPVSCTPISLPRPLLSTVLPSSQAGYVFFGDQLQCHFLEGPSPRSLPIRNDPPFPSLKVFLLLCSSHSFQMPCLFILFFVWLSWVVRISRTSWLCIFLDPKTVSACSQQIDGPLSLGEIRIGS